MHEKTRKLVTAGMLTGIILLLGLTGLGYPYVPPFKLTIVQVPVAIGAMVLGPWYGLFFGLLFGGTSMYQAAIGGLPTAPMFLDLRVAVIPRLCVPIMAYLSFKLMNKLFKEKKRVISGAIGGIIASLTNTVLVLGAIYLFYGPRAASMIGIPAETLLAVLLGIVVSSGFPEAAASGLLCGPIMAALAKLRKE